MKEFDPADLGRLGDDIEEESKKPESEDEVHISEEQLIDLARLEKDKTTENFKDISDEEYDDAFIRRDAVVKIYTSQFKIIGNILIPAEGTATRLTDLLNNGDRNFIPITNAKVLSVTSGRVVDSDCFVVINKTDISVLVPIKEPPKPDTEVKF